jgi:hypothetical protein
MLVSLFEPDAQWHGSLDADAVKQPSDGNIESRQPRSCWQEIHSDDTNV